MHCETESLHGQYENKKVNTKIRVLPQEAGFSMCCLLCRLFSLHSTNEKNIERDVTTFSSNLANKNESVNVLRITVQRLLRFATSNSTMEV